MIARALPDESDPDVQRTLMTTLVRIGTPEAIQQLVDVAGPNPGPFKKKTTPMPLLKKAPIQLQTHGGEIRWRNIYVREIPAAEANAILRKHGGAGV